MPVNEIIGWAGFLLLVAAWVPQTIDTIKAGKTDVNMVFIILYVSVACSSSVCYVVTFKFRANFFHSSEVNEFIV